MLVNISSSKIAELCNKYSAALPRYTSYPTVVELAPCGDPAPALNALQLGSTSPLYLYIHLPYCPNLCHFCACNKIHSTDPEDNRRYLQLLKRECELIRCCCGTRLKIAALHLGGGSPSYLEASDLEELDRILREHFDIPSQTSKSMEIDPRTFNPVKAECAAALGFKRFSIGVQDFDEKVQSAINRNQPGALSEECVSYVRRAGSRSLNLDLIYGLPEQQLRQFSETARRAAALRPERIALFGYAHVGWKAHAQAHFAGYHVPAPQERIDLFLAALTILCEAGYKYIGLDHFALPQDSLWRAYQSGTMKRSFMGYIDRNFAGTLAIGCSSISDLNGCLYQNCVDIGRYSEMLQDGRLPIAKMLVRSNEDCIRAFIIERLMCDSSLHNAKVLEHFSGDHLAAEIFTAGMKLLEPLADDGLVMLAKDAVSVTPTGRLFVRQIASVFDAYLAKHRSGCAPRFSQGI